MSFARSLPATRCACAKSGHDLVQRIPRNTGGTAAMDHVLDLGIIVGKGADQARPGRILAFLEFAQDVIDAMLELRVPRGGVHQRSRREVVTQRMAMAADVRPGADRFPAAVYVRLGPQACVDAEIVQHPVGFELQEVILVAFLGRQGMDPRGVAHRLTEKAQKMEPRSACLTASGAH